MCTVQYDASLQTNRKFENRCKNDVKGSVSRDCLPLFFQYFRIRFRFRRDNRSQGALRGVLHSAEIISAVYKIPRRSSLYADLSGVQHTAEINCTPRKQNQILHLSMVIFKETIRKNPFRGEHIHHERKSLRYKMLIYFKKKCLSQRCAAHCGDYFVIEYLSEIGTEFENTLSCLSGAQIGLNHEKNRGQKSRDTFLVSELLVTENKRAET